jgi:peptide/nickel transport system permease protein
MTVKPTDSNADDTPDATAQTDGGQELDADLFTRTSDVPELTRKQKLVQVLDTYLYAPFSVMVNDWRGAIGIGIVVVFVLMATVGDWVTPTSPVMDGPPTLVPFENMQHPLGTDKMGQDMLKRTINAAPAMLKMILSGALLSVGIGTAIGTVAGYKGGSIDSVLMSITDIVLTLPGLVLIVVLAAIYQPESPFLVGILLGIDNWPGLARTIRSQVLSIREEAFTEASRAMGLSEFQILRKNVISNLMPYISVNFANGAKGIIFESVGLYFLGILPFTVENWGVMMNNGYNGADLTDPGQVHLLFVPMFMIVFVSLGFILLAQALDRVFNVRLRARHSKTAGGEDEDPDLE